MLKGDKLIEEHQSLRFFWLQSPFEEFESLYQKRHVGKYSKEVQFFSEQAEADREDNRNASQKIWVCSRKMQKYTPPVPVF